MMDLHAGSCFSTYFLLLLLVLLTLLLDGATAAPPSPAGTKRSVENIEFGNQQNPPVSLLDDTALPGVFPSSETTGWGMPVVYGAAAYPVRRRRSVHSPARRPDPRKVPQVPLKVLRAGQRHKRDLRRYRRDLATGGDLEKLLSDVDVVELLAMLARPPHRGQGGYGTVTYAPAPPRYITQPKLFPDYEDEESEVEETEEESGGAGGVSLLPQSVRATHLPQAVMVPAGGRVWRRSGGYGLSSIPGFKRSSSAFRANKPRPPLQGFTGDLYSLAAMLGAELDPVTHRLRRAAM
ncbi:hypothetical protein OTU49_015220 [Cherax quadricarinatus]|uniref:Uncharacterized protein n=1 Tax=Cherax quadricarinatus TaxID=27406 RepID=A0AAW0YE19_CHEQU